MTTSCLHFEPMLKSHLARQLLTPTEPYQPQYQILQLYNQQQEYLINLELLKQMRLLDGRPLNIIELPMPSPVIYEDTRLPASYANFYIANAAVIVPTFRDINDKIALEIIQKAFPDRPVVGIDSTDIIWGLGSFHCLSQQEPAV
jgi:agmatine/peptidylarginine deiminase